MVVILYAPDQIPGLLQQINEEAALSDLLAREVDFVMLNNASPIIRYQILKTGTLLIKHDERSYTQFLTDTFRDYFDLKTIRKPIEASLNCERTI